MLGQHSWFLHGPCAVISSKCFSWIKPSNSNHSQVRCATLISIFQRETEVLRRNMPFQGHPLLSEEGVCSGLCGLSPCVVLFCTSNDNNSFRFSILTMKYFLCTVWLQIQPGLPKAMGGGRRISFFSHIVPLTQKPESPGNYDPLPEAWMTSCSFALPWSSSCPLGGWLHILYSFFTLLPSLSGTAFCRW